jgi:hypothetical protein
MSSSSTAGNSAATSDKRTSTSISASIATGGAPRKASSARDPRARNQIARQKRVQRRQRQRGVALHLDHHAAAAEAEHRAEHRIARDAGQQLAPARTQRHRLHQHPFEHRLRRALGQARAQRGKRAAHRFPVGHVEHHAADFGFVRDTRRDDLHRYRKADRARVFDRRVGRRRKCGAGGRNAEGREHLLGFQFGQPHATRRLRGADDAARLGGIDLGRLHQRPRHLQAQLAVAHEAGQIRKRFHPALGTDGRRQAGVVEDVPPASRVFAAEPGGDHRLFGRQRHRQQGACGVFGAQAHGRAKQQ